MKKTDYKTIVLSDIHLGTEGSKVRDVTSFLHQFSCEVLILNGDIIDGWQLKKYGTWKRKHTSFIRAVLKKIEKDDTKVIYVRGNHDDFLDQVVPLNIGPNFSIVKDLILSSGEKSFYVTHGDILDHFTTEMKWLAYLGDVGYTFLLWINKRYNHYRTKKGKSYYSLSKNIKDSIKLAVKYITDYEIKITEMAKAKNCDGIICGHIHQPTIKNIDGTTYMNSGDWIENNSALVESHDHSWDLMFYRVQRAQRFDDSFEPEKRNEMENEGAFHDLFSLK